MNDINVVYLNLNQYYMFEHPELNQFVDEEFAQAVEVGACLEWKYNFDKCIESDISKLKEKSIDFLLEFYSKELLCYKVMSSKENETTVYMFFKDDRDLCQCLSRPGLASYKDEIGRDYKAYMKDNSLTIFQLLFGEPQEFLGMTDISILFNIAYILVVFPIFLHVDSWILKAVMMICIFAFVGTVEKMFRKKNK